MASYAFELPLVLTGFALSETSALNKVVVAEALKPKLVLSESVLDYGNRIMLSEKVKAVPYTTVVTFTNNDTEPIEWVLGKPADMLPEGVKNIFKIEPKEGRLAPDEQCEVRMTFLPRQPVKYSVAVPLFLRPELEHEYLSIKMEGIGTRPRMAFDVMECQMPVVPLGVTSVAQFTIVNHGYDNLELELRLPADTFKMPIELEWPEGKIIGLAKQTLPVNVSFLSKEPLSFTGDVELIDEDGIRFALPVTGMTDNCVLTSYPFLAANEELYDDMTVADGQPLALPVPDVEDQVWEVRSAYLRPHFGRGRGNVPFIEGINASGFENKEKCGGGMCEFERDAACKPTWEDSSTSHALSVFLGVRALLALTRVVDVFCCVFCRCRRRRGTWRSGPSSR